MTIRIGRWELSSYRRAIHLTRGPEPCCPTCAGHGGVEVYVTPDIAETELCDCWDPTPVARIPLWFHRSEAVPF